jgi:hypothetical protein
MRKLNMHLKGGSDIVGVRDSCAKAGSFILTVISLKNKSYAIFVLRISVPVRSWHYETRA